MSRYREGRFLDSFFFFFVYLFFYSLNFRSFGLSILVILVFVDGMIFKGTFIGVLGSMIGEVVFNIVMIGY